jgi:exodeoxyribonuclease VII large subunit
MVDRSSSEPIGIAAYLELLNTFLKRDTVRLTGEVTEAQQAASGHVYFTVKDARENATLSAVAWKYQYLRSGVRLERGMAVILSGTANIYPPTGRLSFVAETIVLVGEGALQKAYEELKKKLEREGLFAPGRKRPLPEFPRTIGVVTSKEGAVIHDFVNNLGRFGYMVELVDARVEGQQAVESLLEAARTFRARLLDVLVVIRGGGSLESLQGFNNEMLVRELASFPVPVIAGIGHDKDVPLVSLAADAMVSTPTAAAHLLNRSWEEAYAKLREIPHLTARIGEALKRFRADLSLAWDSIADHTGEGLTRSRELLARAEEIARLHDPARQLSLGYAIARKGGRIVRRASEVKAGDPLAIQVADGTIESVAK